jgi:hypothetical protein
MSAAPRTPDELAGYMRQRIEALLKADPVCLGRVSISTITAIAAECAVLSPAGRDLADTSIPAELADVIAYLERRRDNTAAMEARTPQHSDWARERRRQIDVILGELRAGLHKGAAG